MRQLAIPARRVLLVSLAECFVCSEHLGPLADVLQAHEQSDGTGQQRALLQIYVLQSVLRCSGVMLRKCHLNAHRPFIEKSLHACMHLPETHHGRWHWTHFPLACTQQNRARAPERSPKSWSLIRPMFAWLCTGLHV